VDRSPVIKISANRRVQDTFEAISEEQRTMYSGVLFEYIQANLKHFKPTPTTNLFEKDRGTDADREVKFKFIALYNEQQDQLINYQDKKNEFELGIICDNLLDLLRY
jgi:hypothetical protein